MEKLISVLLFLQKTTPKPHKFSSILKLCKQSAILKIKFVQNRHMKKLILNLIAITLTTNFAFAQIPNNGFENWTSMGSYNNPDNWDQLNAMTSSMSVYTATKGTPGNPGTAYLKLVSKNVTGMGIMPGIATTGKINVSNITVTGGFAFTQRPQSLTGAWQYMMGTNDTGFAAIYLTKWNTSMGMRDTVAMSWQKLFGMGAMSWTNFTINLMYMSGGNPDTAQIILSSSGMTPVAGSQLFVDNLAFAGSVAGIKQNKLNAEIKLFPNPTSDKLTVSLTNSKTTKGQIEISDFQGKKVKSINNFDFSSATTIDISDLNKGEYIIKLISAEGIISQKFLKQ